MVKLVYVVVLASPNKLNVADWTFAPMGIVMTPAGPVPFWEKVCS